MNRKYSSKIWHLLNHVTLLILLVYVLVSDKFVKLEGDQASVQWFMRIDYSLVHRKCVHVLKHMLLF